MLGLGPGGEHVAIKLARAGLDVIGVEDRLVGGECPYYGCVPSKMMIAAAHVVADARKVARVRRHGDGGARLVRGRPPDPRRGHRRLGRRRRGQAARGQRRPFRARPRACSTGPDGSASAARRTPPARAWCSTPAPRPAAPPIDGLEGTPYWTNRDAVTVTELPASLVVLGGGPIGCEFAQVFARFGVDVTVVEMADRLVAVEEPEASERAREGVRRRGHHGARPVRRSTRSTHDDDGFTLRVDGKPVRAEKLLVAAGRHANLDYVGLDTVGPARRPQGGRDRRADARRASKLWAIGDITGKGAFTHVSMYQAAVVVRDVLGEDGPWADYRAVPRVTFTSPGGRLGGAEREGRARRRASTWRSATGDLGARGWLAKEEGSSSSSPTGGAASSSAAASWPRRAARSCRCSRRPCTRRSRWPRC